METPNTSQHIDKETTARNELEALKNRMVETVSAANDGPNERAGKMADLRSDLDELEKRMVSDVRTAVRKDIDKLRATLGPAPAPNTPSPIPNSLPQTPSSTPSTNPQATPPAPDPIEEEEAPPPPAPSPTPTATPEEYKDPYPNPADWKQTAANWLARANYYAGKGATAVKEFFAQAPILAPIASAVVGGFIVNQIGGKAGEAVQGAFDKMTQEDPLKNELNARFGMTPPITWSKNPGTPKQLQELTILMQDAGQTPQQYAPTIRQRLIAKGRTLNVTYADVLGVAPRPLLTPAQRLATFPTAQIQASTLKSPQQWNFSRSINVKVNEQGLAAGEQTIVRPITIKRTANGLEITKNGTQTLSASIIVTGSMPGYKPTRQFTITQ